MTRPSGSRLPGADGADAPPSPETLSAALRSLLGTAPEGLALAVSGGSDSRALMEMAARLPVRPARLLVLTVDHGVRPEAAAEAATVAARAQALGVAAQVLRWEGAPADGNFQAAARAARYRLMAEACRAAGIAVLATAHTRDDQAETVLARLARGAGVDGLCGISPVLDAGAGVRIVRPLLGAGRQELRDWLRGEGIADWVDDPSNEARRFDRVRHRRLLALLAEEGLDAGALAGLAGRMRDARDALDSAASSLAGTAARFDPLGFAVLDREIYAAAPAEVRRRALLGLLRAVSGRTGHPPRFDRLGRLDRLLAGTGCVRATLNGAVVRTDGREVLMLREGRGAMTASPVAVSGGAVWDGRFRLEGDAAAPLSASALGVEGIAILRSQGVLPKKGGLPVPHAVFAATLALWRGGTLAGVPALGWAAADARGISARFPAFPPFAQGKDAQPVVADPLSLW
ncbi:tRNA lysidine(34) synthetase TilS [Futiania mangrovi]|uniref:tRNA(Ile)-lysidine synthase n=1 Tax=Futiania mangrovi TaxID=2959716 RepID=A0A9J6P9H5_9PROT|nr:tRNA lysidine(34) synthetase TilS [Futiania mangrovii]MCP1334897.1 tRNA lysidine(34) synthetase TilS [Futiania mangrovii]